MLLFRFLLLLIIRGFLSLIFSVFLLLPFRVLLLLLKVLLLLLPPTQGTASALTIGVACDCSQSNSPNPAHLESLCIPKEQCVEQCGLASPTGTHDGQHLPWQSLASHWTEIGIYCIICTRQIQEQGDQVVGPGEVLRIHHQSGSSLKALAGPWRGHSRECPCPQVWRR